MNDFKKILEPLQDFFSLGIKKIVQITFLEGILDEVPSKPIGIIDPLVFLNNEVPNWSKVRFSFDNIKDKFPMYLGKWFNSYEKFANQCIVFILLIYTNLIAF